MVPPCRLPSPHVRNRVLGRFACGIRGSERVGQAGSVRTARMQASVVQADATGQSISQSIISNVPTTNCYMYIHKYTYTRGGGIDESSGRVVQ